MKFFQHMYFLYKAHLILLVLRNIRQLFSIKLGAILDSEITNKKHKNVKRVALNLLQKDIFTVWELKGEGRALPCTSAENMCIRQLKISSILSMYSSANDH